MLMQPHPDREITFEGICSTIGLVALGLAAVFFIAYIHLHGANS